MVISLPKVHSEPSNPVADIPVTRPWAATLPPPVVMMGVPFDQVTTEQTIGIIEDMISARRPHLVATANVDFLAQASKDAELRGILLDAELVVCDGTPLLWISRLLGDPLPERVAGSDLVPLLLKLAEDRGYRIFFLGGREEVLEAATRNILQMHPNLQIAGAWSPPFAPLDQMDHAGICARVRESKADILLVSFGCPKQEKWLAMNYRQAGVPVNIGVGATIDFLAGAVKRAPVWMRRTGLEWVYRTLQEPRRLAKRYLTDFRIVGFGILRQLWTLRGRGFFKSRPLPDFDEDSPFLSIPVSSMSPAPCHVVELPARLDAMAAREPHHWEEIDKGDAAYIIVDGSAVDFLDSTGTGKLVRLARIAKERGGKLFLAAPSKALRQALSLMRLQSYFTETASVEAARASLPPVEPEVINRRVILTWPSDVIAANVAQLTPPLFTAIESSIPDGPPIIVRMSEVEFVDSTGVGFMLRATRMARLRGVPLQFTGVTDPVRRLLELMNSADYLLNLRGATLPVALSRP